MEQTSSGRGSAQGAGVRAIAVALLVASLVIAGCGNRLSRDEIQAQNEVELTADGLPVGSGLVAGVGTSSGGFVVGGADSGTGSANNSITAGPGNSGTGATGTNAADGGPSGPTNGGASSSATGVGSQGGGTAATTIPVPDKDPIIIGLVGYFSGIGGPVHIPKRDAYLVWEQKTNAAGGINGHPVKVLVGDDGGNESRAVSLARDFVENKGAIALSTTGSTQGGVVTYAESKSVPVIGIGGGPSAAARESPMMFQTGPAGEAAVWGWAAVAKSAGISKIAVIYCAESAECTANSEDFAAEAERQGMEVVAQLRASVTQPDYTAECLQSQAAGAELIFPITDNTAPIRIAQSCARQDYRPIFELGSASDSQADIPELEGALVPSDAFPWILRSGSPGVVEYASALETYAPKMLTDGARDQASAWVAVKVFEKAAAKVGDVPTSADLLEGLWSLKGETLDGLAPAGLARTYVRGEPTGPAFCTFPIKLVDGEWVAPRGLEPLCR